MFSKIKRKDRNWEGIRDIFRLTRCELVDMIIHEALTSEDKLIQECASRNIENTDTLLNQILFFRDHMGYQPQWRKLNTN